METLTGISGSGPAYIYYMMEAMIAAGIRGGLPLAQSRELTVQTVLGAARMVQQTGEEPASLRKGHLAEWLYPSGDRSAGARRFLRDRHFRRQPVCGTFPGDGLGSGAGAALIIWPSY